MDRAAEQNRRAWEWDAYAFWVAHAGRPEERAQAILRDPRGALKKYAGYFGACEGLRVANVCGSCGKKAVPLAVLGARVTVFDFSRENARYTGELAQAAGVSIDYVIGDVMDIDRARYGGAFDLLFMEGGVLHYFHDLAAFFAVLNGLLRPRGRMILSDFHPFQKIQDALALGQEPTGYFSEAVVEGEMAHARFPRRLYRRYTISEILNAALDAGFAIKRFDEHPAWNRPDLPGEFTLAAEKAD
jgi:2-polyprenyl-3-methyl-5-hydroxy-6-metoxy-1,4-benzoquinol methylase